MWGMADVREVLDAGGEAAARVHSVKLIDVGVAAVCGVEGLTHELAAFVVLEATQRLREIGGGLATPERIVIDTRGEVTLLACDAADDVPSARALRTVLDGLLQVTPTSTAKLRLCACRPEPAGLALLARELEGALGGVDREALVRSLSTLARQVFRAVAGGEFEPDSPDVVQDWTSTRVVAEEPEPIVAAPPVEAIAIEPTPEVVIAAPTDAPIVAPKVAEPIEPKIDSRPEPAPASLPTTYATLPDDRDERHRLELAAVRREHEAALAALIADRDRRLALFEAERDRRIAAVEVDRARRVREAEEERDRRVHDVEKERDRRVQQVEAEAARKVLAVEAERDRKVLSMERALDMAEARHRLELEELVAERDAILAEGEATRARQLEEATAKLRKVIEGARDRAIAEVRAAHEAELAGLRTDHDMERKELRARIEELEYSFARANAERDNERMLRVDGEVAAANRLRELRRTIGTKKPEEESDRVITYRDADDRAKWWK